MCSPGLAHYGTPDSILSMLPSSCALAALVLAFSQGQKVNRSSTHNVNALSVASLNLCSKELLCSSLWNTHQAKIKTPKATAQTPNSIPENGRVVLPLMTTTCSRTIYLTKGTKDHYRLPCHRCDTQ